jgi:hypothetical protein
MRKHMHGLPPTLDLSFFKDRALLQVCVGENELILNFEESVSVNVSSRIGWIGAKGRRDTYEDFSKAATAVITLLHDVVVSAHGDTKGTLTLDFGSGVKLEFYDTSQRHESYLIKHQEELIVV